MEQQGRMNQHASSEATEGFLYALFNFYVSGYYLDLKSEKYYAIGQTSAYNERYGAEDDWVHMDDYIRECVNEEDQPLITEFSRIAYIRARLKKEQSYSIEIRDHGTGEERWYRYTTMRGADADHAAISFMDVTDQVMQRQKLERLTQSVQEELELNQTLGIYSWRILVDEKNNMRYIDWSENACKFMEIAAKPGQHASMRTMYSIIHPDLLPAFIMELQKTIMDASGKYVFAFDNKQEMHDGSVKWFHCSGKMVTLPNGGERAIVGAFRDNTDSYLVQEEQQELTEVRDLMQAARWTAQFNYDGTIRSVVFSDEVRRSLGYESEADFPNDMGFWKSIMHPDDVERREADLMAAVIDQTGETVYDEKYRLRKKDGAYLWVRSAISIHRDEVGNAESAIGVFVDINDSVLRLQAEQALREANEEQNAQLEEITALNTQLEENQTKLEEAAAEQEAQIEEITALNAQLQQNQAELEASVAELEEEREKVSEAYGMIEGLSQEYHTIWIVNKETARMRLIRSSGKSTIQRAVRMGLDEPEFDPAFDNYIGSCVEPEDRDRMHREIAFAEVLRQLTEQPDRLYAVNYLRRDDSGHVGYHQIAFANADTQDGRKQFVYGFRDVDQLVKEEQKQKEVLQEALKLSGEAAARQTAQMEEISALNSELQENQTKLEESAAEQELQFEQIQALNKALHENQEGAIRKLLAEFDRLQSEELTEQLMKAVGEYFHADRSYIFETSEDGRLTVNTYEWCADGVQPEIQNLQEVPIGVIEPWNVEFRKSGCFYISCDSEYAAREPIVYEVLEPQGISSLMAAPIVVEGSIIGFLGVDNPKENIEHKLFLSIAASMIYHEIRIRKDKLREEKYQQELQSRIDEITYLNKTAAEYNDIMSSAGYGMWHIILKDGAEPRMQVNDKMAQLLGVAGQRLREEELYHAWYDNIVPEAIPSVQASVGEMLAGSFSENTYQWIHPAKGAIYVRCGGTAVKLEDGSDYISGYHADVTDIVYEEKKQKEELENIKNAALLENEIISSISKMYFAIFRIDLAQNYYEEISSDNSVHIITGHEGNAQEKMNELCASFVTDKYRDGVREFFELSTIEERLRELDTIEYQYHASDGNWHEARFIAKKRNEEGTVTHILYVTRVISAIKQKELETQEALRKAKDAAEAANRAKSAFLFNMSHDIRTPMNAIIGYANLMKRNQVGIEKWPDYLDKILQSSDFLLGLINNVLEMARIESGKTVLDENIYSVDAFTDHLYSVFADEMGKKDLNFTRSVEVQHQYLYFDNVKLREIFLNILSNAQKYTLPGGNVAFSVKELPTTVSGYALIETTVADTGIGISEEFLPHIFEEFTREKNSSGNRIQGTGLGMPIVKKLVELMGGTIAVKSRPGEGSTFTVTILHRIAEKPDEKAKDENLDYSDFAGKRILLAEDNDLNAEIAMEILSEFDFQIERAEDGIVCVDKLNRAEAGYYDLILMDIQMPNLDGYGAARKIRALDDPDKADIPIIAMTANAFEEDKRNAIDAGMDGHVAKPIEIAVLIRTLAHLFKDRAAGRNILAEQKS